MRVVHLAPPDAVAARLAALDSGFDDALTTAMPVSELAGRLTWLDAKARHRPGSGSVHVIGMASSWTSSRTSSGGGTGSFTSGRRSSGCSPCERPVHRLTVRGLGYRLEGPQR